MSIREFLKINKSRKIWDRILEKYMVNISYETGVEVTPRTTEVADAFGLGIAQRQPHNHPRLTFML